MPDFTGELGGLIAGTWMTGAIAGWTLYVKLIGDPVKERLKATEERLEALRSTIEAEFWKGRK